MHRVIILVFCQRSIFSTRNISIACSDHGNLSALLRASARVHGAQAKKQLRVLDACTRARMNTHINAHTHRSLLHATVLSCDPTLARGAQRKTQTRQMCAHAYGQQKRGICPWPVLRHFLIHHPPSPPLFQSKWLI